MLLMNRAVLPLENQKASVNWKALLETPPTTDQVLRFAVYFKPPAWAVATGRLYGIIVSDLLCDLQLRGCNISCALEPTRSIFLYISIYYIRAKKRQKIDWVHFCAERLFLARTKAGRISHLIFYGYLIGDPAGDYGLAPPGIRHNPTRRLHHSGKTITLKSNTGWREPLPGYETVMSANAAIADERFTYKGSDERSATAC
jgi:hypothetical protein